MKQINFTNEKGNVQAKVRANLNEQAVARLQEVIPNGEMTNKGYAVQIGVDAGTGKEIFAIFNVVISTEKVGKEKTRKTKEAEVVEVPAIFEAE